MEMNDEFKELAIDVVGGLCTIYFAPNWSCGKEEGTNPGIGFRLVSTHKPMSHPNTPGQYYAGMGVFSRNDAQKLVDMLNEFLKEHPVK